MQADMLSSGVDSWSPVRLGPCQSHKSGASLVNTNASLCTASNPVSTSAPAAGVAFFYGGMSQHKNVVSTIMQVGVAAHAIGTGNLTAWAT